MNQIAKDFKRLEDRLQDILQRMEEAKVWRRLRASEHGEILFSWVQAQIAACFSRFAAEKLDSEGFCALQAETKVLHRILSAGYRTDEQIDDWETEAQGLRDQIKKRQNTGLDRDFSRPTQQAGTQ